MQNSSIFFFLPKRAGLMRKNQLDKLNKMKNNPVLTHPVSAQRGGA
jgi:hypothetical protein